jgi:hypothetical protein
MNDRELLDVVAQDAPARTDFADEVVQMAQRARRKRRTAALAAAAGLVVAGFAVTVVAPWAHNSHERVQAQTRLAPPTAPDPMAAPYALAIKTLVDKDTSKSPSASRQVTLYVLDHTCSGVNHRPFLQCGGQPLSSDLRTGMAGALRGFASIHFLADPKGLGSPHPRYYPNNGYLVILGPIRFEGPQAEVPIAMWRGFDDGRGEVTLLTNRKGQWTVGGTPRQGADLGGWIT